jgi:hypothetical protein
MLIVNTLVPVFRPGAPGAQLRGEGAPVRGACSMILASTAASALTLAVAIALTFAGGQA